MRDEDVSENVPANYGVPVGETVRTEWLALQVYARYNKDITEDFNIKTRYQMFANYEELSFENTDHRLDLTLTANITSLINVSFTSINLYDIDQHEDIQFSTGIALGIMYKINS